MVFIYVAEGRRLWDKEPLGLWPVWSELVASFLHHPTSLSYSDASVVSCLISYPPIVSLCLDMQAPFPFTRKAGCLTRSSRKSVLYVVPWRYSPWYHSSIRSGTKGVSLQHKDSRRPLAVTCISGLSHLGLLSPIALMFARICFTLTVNRFKYAPVLYVRFLLVYWALCPWVSMGAMVC